MRETLRLEDAIKDDVPGLLDCFREPNMGCLIICVMAYDVQAFRGNILFIDYVVYFFELDGLEV